MPAHADPVAELPGGDTLANGVDLDTHLTGTGDRERALSRDERSTDLPDLHDSHA